MSKRYEQLKNTDVIPEMSDVVPTITTSGWINWDESKRSNNLLDTLKSGFTWHLKIMRLNPLIHLEYLQIILATI